MGAVLRFPQVIEMWESPIYRIEKYVGKARPELITVDVTQSAPSMQKPGGALEGVFSILTKTLKPQRTKILDIGAAKLRNTLYLLKKGFKVYAVEFPQLAERSPQAKKNWDKAQASSDFQKLIFPVDFFKLPDKVDLSLMINVTNVMPIPNERLALLAITREKMKDDGLLLWYNWRDISSHPEKYTKTTSLNDGFFKGEGREVKTFHGEWDRPQVIEMLRSTGFTHDEDIDLPEVSGNQALVFRANGPVLIDKYLGLQEIMNGATKRDPAKVISEEPMSRLPDIYLGELKKTRSGKHEQGKFHRLAARLLANIFDHQLKKPIIEYEINEGRGRIDVKFQNQNKPGFFKNAKDMRNILCPEVFVECKNYEDLENPDFDQLAGRLNSMRGQLGILVCRRIGNRNKSIAMCKDRLKDSKYIIVLDDSDLAALWQKKSKGNEQVDDYMEEELAELVR